jgi:tetratricopeptide (TPR) repeat protein
VYTYSQLVHVWDLRLIRARLKEIGLDWEWREFPAVDKNGTAARPLTVKVLLGDLAPEQKAREAIAQYRTAVAAKPDDATACNDLAWAYLIAPEPLRDVKAALPLAEKAAQLAPGDAVIRNTLGLAYYRAGRYREAIDTLRPQLAHQEDWCLAFDLYILAMSHQRLGEAARAQDYYDWAVRWTKTQQGLSAAHVEELSLLRAEAEQLLNEKQKKE